jgi:hypothetical protein
MHDNAIVAVTIMNNHVVTHSQHYHAFLLTMHTNHEKNSHTMH